MLVAPLRQKASEFFIVIGRSIIAVRGGLSHSVFSLALPLVLIFPLLAFLPFVERGKN